MITFRVTSAILICSRAYLFIKIPENDQNLCSKNQLSFTDPFFSSKYLIKSLFSDVQMKKKSCWNSVGSLNINFVHIRKFLKILVENTKLYLTLKLSIFRVLFFTYPRISFYLASEDSQSLISENYFEMCKDLIFHLDFLKGLEVNLERIFN